MKIIMPNQSDTVSIGLVGYGYWGPNLARNFSRRPGCIVAHICDRDPRRAALAETHYPQATVCGDYQRMLDDPAVKAVLIATPVESHFPLAKLALEAGKDVLVEKPFTMTVEEGEILVALAERLGRVLAVDHTFLFTGAVQKIRDLVDSGELGDLIYMDSVRVNLGLFQNDVNVVWDLAPHDLSIFSYLLRRTPSDVRAMGLRYGSQNLESLAYLHLEYDGMPVAHCHLNWLSPAKLRLMMIAGTRRMIVFDDMEHSEKVKVYDKGISIPDGDWEAANRARVDYRSGDMWAPKVSPREALDLEAEEFLNCVRTRATPSVDGRFGLEIVRQLEAAQRSIVAGGERVRVTPR